jgi:hypothetical protein
MNAITRRQKQTPSPMVQGHSFFIIIVIVIVYRRDEAESKGIEPCRYNSPFAERFREGFNSIRRHF